MIADDTPSDLSDDASADEIKADIDATRERLASSVEDLAAKADVKAQATHAVNEVRDKARQTAGDAKEQLGQTTDRAVVTFNDLPPAAQIGLALAPVVLIVLLIVRAVRRR